MTGNNGLPQGWEKLRLGNITEPSKEKVHPKDLPGVPYIGLEHIEKETGRLLGQGVSDDVRSTKAVFHPGDLLYGKLRPYLNKVYVPEFDGICSTDILVFPKNDRIDNRYLFALPQKSLWVMRGREHFPALDKFLELPFGLFTRTSMKSERGTV
jgi:type I restriction enzyme S subunit